MKFLNLVFTATIGFNLVLAQVPPQFASIMQAHLQCQTSSGVTPVMMSGVMNGNLPNNPAMRRHLLCINQILGVQDSNGNISRNTLMQLADSMAPSGVNRSMIQRVVNRCAVERNTAEETAFEMDRCIFRSRSAMTG